MSETTKYAHGEAFMLMQYVDEVTGETEILWNSRDGVTPFMINSRRGNRSVHQNWRADIRRPDFKPTPGMRIFVDARPDQPHIISSATEYVSRHWEGGEYAMKDSGHWPTPEAAIKFFIDDWTKPGSPTVIEVAA